MSVDSSNDKRLSLKGNIAWNTIGSFFNQGCVWAITVVVVILSSGFDNSGILAYAMALGNIYGPIATYNMRTIQVSDVRNELSASTYVGFRILTVVIAYLVLVAYLFITTSSPSLIIATLCWLLYKADEAFVIVYYGIYQKAMRMDYLGVSQIIRGIVTLGAFSLILFLQSNVDEAIIGVSVACLLVTVFYDHRHARCLADVRPSLNVRLSFELLRKYFPAVLAIFFYAAVTSGARQIFESSYGEAALGIYAAIATPAAVIPVLAQYLYGPLIGNISTLWFEKKHAEYKQIIQKVLLIIGSVFLGALILAFAFGEQVLTLVYGEKIREYAFLLAPTLVATAATTLFIFLFDMTLVLRGLNVALIAASTALTLSLMLTYLLIPKYYMNGVNIALMISFLVGASIEYIFIRVKLLRLQRLETK